MSMFYELMMRKKEQIMYATIKGSLTENDGVFSGFSSSNYLKLQQQFQPEDKNWEIVIKTEITQLNVVQTIIGSSTNSKNIQLAIRDTNIIRFYRTTTGIDDIVVNSSLTIDSLGVYYFKISFNGSQYKVSVSQDGNNYIDYIISTNSTPIYNNSSVLALGYNGRSASEYFRGSIDLNNSYINLGSTKYNLQAVVGYTIVGSPTITDGVVSGFSSSDYIYVPNFDIGNDFELITKFKITETNNNNYILRLPKGNVNLNMILYLNNTNKISLALYYNNKPNTATAGTTVFNLDTDIYIKIIQKGNITKLFSSLDKSNWIEEMSIQTDKDIRGGGTGYDMSFGIASISSGYYFHGEIYIGETIIKTNNKLWFNGQQA